MTPEIGSSPGAHNSEHVMGKTGSNNSGDVESVIEMKTSGNNDNCPDKIGKTTSSEIQSVQDKEKENNGNVEFVDSEEDDSEDDTENQLVIKTEHGAPFSREFMRARQGGTKGTQTIHPSLRRHRPRQRPNFRKALSEEGK